MLDQTGKVWVADFGLAQCRGASNLTSQGERLGTARYMSPEQATGRMQEVDFRTDIYSLGVTLYELLTLRPAFDEQTREQLLAAVETQEPASMCRLNPATSCAATIVVFAVTAAVLASIFFQQRERERLAAEQARFHLQQAHLVVERFSDVWSNRLKEIAGTERLQAELLAE